MPGFDLGSAANSAAGWVCGSAPARKILRNPLATTLLLSALLAVVGLAVYGPELRRAGRKPAVRAVIYWLIAATGVLGLHFYALERSLRGEVENDKVRDVFAGVELSRRAGGGVQARPAIDGWAPEPAGEGGASRPPGPPAPEPRTGGAARPDNLEAAPLEEIRFRKVL